MKELKKIIKIEINAGEAKAVPPLGPILSQVGINAAMFIKDYNYKTQNNKGTIVPVKIKIFTDNSYTMELLTEPISKLILKKQTVDNYEKNKEMWGLTKLDLVDIYNTKKNEFNTKNIEKAIKMILGTAKNIYLSKKK